VSQRGVRRDGRRAWWKARLEALWLTIALSLFMTCLVTLFTGGSRTCRGYLVAGARAIVVVNCVSRSRL